MLLQRVVTAIVMLVVLLGAVLVPRPEPLLILLILMATCAVWEWLRLVLPGSDDRSLAGGVAMMLILSLFAFQWFGPDPALWAQDARHVITVWLMPIAVAAWVFGATAAVVRARLDVPEQFWRAVPAFGAVVAVWAALSLLYVAYGWWLLLSLMALVWCADIAAYFTGRALGRNKLAPRVSPGKSWEGAVGGVVAATAWTLFSAQWEGSFGALLQQYYSLPVAAALAAALAALSIVGDLYESLLKRRAGVKDSSALLPGHGGILDRIDALLPVAPAAFLLLQAS